MEVDRYLQEQLPQGRGDQPDSHTVRNVAPFIHFSLFFPLFVTLTHTLLL
jgi:hypothetical protein